MVKNDKPHPHFSTNPLSKRILNLEHQVKLRGMMLCYLPQTFHHHTSCITKLKTLKYDKKKSHKNIHTYIEIKLFYMIDEVIF